MPITEIRTGIEDARNQGFSKIYEGLVFLNQSGLLYALEVNAERLEAEFGKGNVRLGFDKAQIEKGEFVPFIAWDRDSSSESESYLRKISCSALRDSSGKLQGIHLETNAGLNKIGTDLIGENLNIIDVQNTTFEFASLARPESGGLLKGGELKTAA